MRLVAEAAAVFVVRVDQEDAQIRPRLEDLLQDNGNATRFADAGSAENGEVPADHMVYVHMNGDVRILLQRADLGAVARRATVDDPQLAISEHGSGVTDGRIIGHAARELADDDLADEVESRHLAEVGAIRGRSQRLLADLGDKTDDERLGRGDAHELADGRGVGGGRVPCREFDHGARAGHGGDAADGLVHDARSRNGRGEGQSGRQGVHSSVRIRSRTQSGAAKANGLIFRPI